jgi:hypothetical protein
MHQEAKAVGSSQWEREEIGGMEEWRNGGMEEWRNGGMEDWRPQRPGALLLSPWRLELTLATSWTLATSETEDDDD